MLRYTIVLVSLLMISCCNKHTKITYEYKGTVITRVDECGITSFYYTNSKNESAGKIWVKYSGINDGFSGYLIFSDNDKVVLCSGDGYFQSENLDSTKFQYKSIIASERPKLGESVCYISSSTRFEIKENKEGGSRIKIDY